MSTARQIAAERFARGEITVAELKTINTELDALEEKRLGAQSSETVEERMSEPQWRTRASRCFFGGVIITIFGFIIIEARSQALADCRRGVSASIARTCHNTGPGGIIAGIAIFIGLFLLAAAWGAKIEADKIKHQGLA